MSTLAVPTGLLAGVLMGVVLQRGDLCFHSMFASAGRDTRLLRGWLLGVGVGAVGLSIVYLLPLGDRLNHDLPFRPVRNVVGGLVIGLGMAVARSCTSGLFYKLGAGMLGALVGIGGWIVGEYAASRLTPSEPSVLSGERATLAGLVGLPRLVTAVILLVLVASSCVLLARRQHRRPDADQRSAVPLGIGLGVALVAGWLLARAGGASFGPSTVGATASIARGSPMWWLIGFLVGLVGGGTLGARIGGGAQVRGEQPVRYAQLAAGGVLLGAGGWIAGGCNLGHGLSGTAQLNVASWVAVAAMAAGVLIGRAGLDRLRSRR